MSDSPARPGRRALLGFLAVAPAIAALAACATRLETVAAEQPAPSCPPQQQPTTDEQYARADALAMHSFPLARDEEPAFRFQVVEARRAP